MTAKLYLLYAKLTLTLTQTLYLTPSLTVAAFQNND